MNFTNPESPSNLNDAIKHDAVIKSHGLPEYAMGKNAREIRESEHSVHLDNHEVVLVKKMIADRLKDLDKKIHNIKESIDTYTVSNIDNAEEELATLQEEYRCIRFNLAEKFEN